MEKIFGKYKSICEAAKAYGLSPGTVYTRLSRGWPLEEALETKDRTPEIIVDKYKVDKYKYEIGGKKYRYLTDIAKEYGVPYSSISNRINKGMSIEDAISDINKEKKPSLSELANNAGISYASLRRRMKNGMSLNDALSAHPAKSGEPIVIFGKMFPSRKEAAETYQIKYITFLQRLKSGIDPEHAVSKNIHAKLNPVEMHGIIYPTIEDARRCLNIMSYDNDIDLARKELSEREYDYFWKPVVKTKHPGRPKDYSAIINNKELRFSKGATLLIDNIQNFKHADIMVGTGHDGDILKIRVIFRLDKSDTTTVTRVAYGANAFYSHIVHNNICDRLVYGRFPVEKENSNTLSILVKDGEVIAWSPVVFGVSSRNTISIYGNSIYINFGALTLINDYEKYNYLTVLIGVSKKTGNPEKARFVFSNNITKCSREIAKDICKSGNRVGVVCAALQKKYPGTYEVKKISDNVLEIDLTQKLEHDN